MTANDLIDIWRIRNPDKKQFTWTQKKPLVRRHLDYWLVSTDVQDDLTETNIIPAILKVGSLGNHSNAYYSSPLNFLRFLLL